MSTSGEMSPRRRRRRRRRTSPSPASLPDDEDMLREILLRLPPRPSSLPRASLVSKRWCSLVADPQFQRRFRDHHAGKPPLLGFFLDDGRSCRFFPMLGRPDCIPRARFSMPPNKDNRIIDCRHGLVLILSLSRPHHLLVWDPVARGQRRLILPPLLDNDQMYFLNAGVLRPAHGQGCHSSHFQVALIAHDMERPRISACLYSSETGIWDTIGSLQLQPLMFMQQPSTLIGNSFCWLLTGMVRYAILEFDLDRKSLALTELPSQIPPRMIVGNNKLWIMPAEDGGLGFIYLSQFHAQLWKRGPDSDGLAVWVLDKAIEFKKLSSTCAGLSLTLLGFAEKSNAIFVHTDSGVYVVYLQSMEFKKLPSNMLFYHHYPFEYCYAAGSGIGDGHGGDEVLNNM